MSLGVFHIKRSVNWGGRKSDFSEANGVSVPVVVRNFCLYFKHLTWKLEQISEKIVSTSCWLHLKQESPPTWKQRGIPTTAYQVLHLLSCMGGTPWPGGRGGTPSLPGGTPPQVPPIPRQTWPDGWMDRHVWKHYLPIVLRTWSVITHTPHREAERKTTDFAFAQNYFVWTNPYCVDPVKTGVQSDSIFWHSMCCEWQEHRALWG